MAFNRKTQSIIFIKRKNSKLFETLAKGNIHHRNGDQKDTNDMDDLWFESIEDFEAPDFIIDSSDIHTTYLIRSVIKKKHFVMHEYDKKNLCEKNEKRVKRCVSMMNYLCHENIIKCFGAWETPESYYIIEEYCYHGTLLYKIVTESKTMKESYIVYNVIKPLLNVMLYLHEQGIIHRGIWPENIYFSKEGYLRLSGFLNAIDIYKSRPCTREGNLDYMAPEILKLNDKIDTKTELNLKIYEKIDVWQIGILTYEILVGKCPFEVNDVMMTSSMILWCDIVEFPDTLSNEAIDFLKLTLNKNPDLRPTIEDLSLHLWLSIPQPVSNLQSFSKDKNFGWNRAKDLKKKIGISRFWKKFNKTANGTNDDEIEMTK